MFCEMCSKHCFVILMLTAITVGYATGSVFFTSRNLECGQYGYICESNKKLRLCDNEKIHGPTFLCPANTVCNEESSDVCESVVNYINPSLSKKFRCVRNERVADPTVPNCKGYILCVQRKNKYQSIRFKCSGNTIFNGITRSCTAPDSYRCPLGDFNTTNTNLKFYNENDDSYESVEQPKVTAASLSRGNLYCKNYKFTLSERKHRAQYFCPPRPTRVGSPTLCTVFSNAFCVTLTREDEDQFIMNNSGATFRKPRDFRLFNYNL